MKKTYLVSHINTKLKFVSHHIYKNLHQDINEVKLFIRNTFINDSINEFETDKKSLTNDNKNDDWFLEVSHDMYESFKTQVHRKLESSLYEEVLTETEKGFIISDGTHEEYYKIKDITNDKIYGVISETKTGKMHFVSENIYHKIIHKIQDILHLYNEYKRQEYEKDFLIWEDVEFASLGYSSLEKFEFYIHPELFDYNFFDFETGAVKDQEQTFDKNDTILQFNLIENVVINN
tara:strand:+ start:10397 stop:11098 length:702 start_codon:yes stop_codon:yes gene_type:complete